MSEEATFLPEFLRKLRHNANNHSSGLIELTPQTWDAVDPLRLLAKERAVAKDEGISEERERLLHMEPSVLARLAWELDHPADEWCGCGHRWSAHDTTGCHAETGNHVYDVWCQCVATPPT